MNTLIPYGISSALDNIIIWLENNRFFLFLLGLIYILLLCIKDKKD